MLIEEATLLVLHHKGGMKVIKGEEHEEKEFQKVIIYDPSIKISYIFLKNIFHNIKRVMIFQREM